jgi:hypothetical protein
MFAAPEIFLRVAMKIMIWILKVCRFMDTHYFKDYWVSGLFPVSGSPKRTQHFRNWLLYCPQTKKVGKHLLS